MLLEEIGRGGHGVVHRALDLRTRRHVAAKVLRGADPEALLRFVREQGHRIEHPHVLAPLGWAAEDDVALLAMELVLGGSVRDLLATRGPLPDAVLAPLLGQLLDALAAVHAQGLVHGDVKPSNLLLRAGVRPHLLLADFGVATRWHEPVGPAGTPAFLPPERLAGAPAAPEPGRLRRRAGRPPRAGRTRTAADAVRLDDPPRAGTPTHRRGRAAAASRAHRAVLRSWVPTTRSRASASAAGEPGAAE